MIAASLERYVLRRPSVALATYLAAVAVLLGVVGLAVADIVERQQAMERMGDLLAQLQGRRLTNVQSRLGAEPGAVGSPFLQGPTVTVAGAALLQRVANAVTNVGGNVFSSQVDVQGPQAQDGNISLTVSCEVDQSSLQKLLYDVEAGMPFLFIEQLDVQVPQSAGNADGGGRLRVMIGVAGQWQRR